MSHYVAKYFAILAVIVTIISYVLAWRFSLFILRRIKQMFDTII